MIEECEFYTSAISAHHAPHPSWPSLREIEAMTLCLKRIEHIDKAAKLRVAQLRCVITALLLMAGIEPNPGPPKVAAAASATTAKPKTAKSEKAQEILKHRPNIEESTLASQEDVTAHTKCLDFIRTLATTRLKSGDILYAIVKDHHSTPPVEFECSIGIKEKMSEASFSYNTTKLDMRGNLKPGKAMCPVFEGPTVTEISGQRRNLSDMFPCFPPRPEEHKADDRFTLVDIKLSPFKSSGNQVAWNDITAQVNSVSPKEQSQRFIEDHSLRTYRSLDTDHKKTHLTHLVKNIIQGYTAIDDNRTLTPAQKIEQKEPILFNFINVPRKHLRVLNGKARQRLRNQHLALQLSGRVIEQITAMRVELTPQQQEERAQNDVALSDMRQIKIAKRQAEEGNIGRAASSLMATQGRASSKLEQARNATGLTDQGKVEGIAAADRELTAQIEKLHPNKPDPDLKFPNGSHFDPLRNVDFPLFSISVPELINTLKNGSSGAAPGVSGWTEELLYDIASRDPAVANNLALIIRDIALCHVTTDFAKRLSDSSLITLDKESGGVRPITLCETFSKIASAIVLARESDALRNALPNQFGVAYSNGTDRIIHETRKHVRTNVAKPGKGAVLTIDFSNAFNAPNRQGMWEKVRDFKLLRRIFALEYSHPSRLLNSQLQKTFWSRAGCRQGTTAGPALFCLTIQAMLDELNKTSGIRALAYMDDITILAMNVTAAGIAMDIVQKHSNRLDLAVNMKKCELLTECTPSELPESLKCLTPVRCLKRLLGATIGLDDVIEKETLEQRVATTHDVFFRRLACCYGPWASALLSSCGVPKINHILRTHAPEVTADVAQRFDEDTESVIRSWTNLDATKMTEKELNIFRAFLHLPVSMGGMGFSRSAHIAASAYSASSSTLFTSDKLMQQSQKAFSEPVNKRVAKYIDDASPLHARHREFNSQKGTASIFRDPTFKANPAAWRMQMLWRTCGRLKGIDDFGLTCPGCKHDHPDYLTFMFHVGTCARINGNNATAAHYKVTKALNQWCHQARLTVDSTEPRELSHVVCPGCSTKMKPDEWNEHKTSCDKCHAAVPNPRITGPDGRIWGVSTSSSADITFTATVYDYTQVGARQSSNISTDMKNLFTARENKKAQLYAELAAQQNQELVTLATTEDGVFNKQGRRLLEALACQTSTDPNDILQYLQQRQQEAHGASLANALYRGKFNKSVYEFDRQTEHNRAKRVQAIKAGKSLTNLALQVVGSDGAAATNAQASTSISAEATGPFLPTLHAVNRRRDRDLAGSDDSSPTRNQYPPLFPLAQSPVAASTKRLYHGNRHVTASRFAELQALSIESLSNPTPRQFAFYMAQRAKIAMLSANCSYGTYLERSYLSKRAVEDFNIPQQVADSNDFIADVRAALHLMNVIDETYGRVILNKPSNFLNSSNTSALSKQDLKSVVAKMENAEALNADGAPMSKKF
jgi:hypothetical protein